MQVFIRIFNRENETRISADDNTNKLIVNGKNVKFDAVSFVEQISVITAGWKESYLNNTVLDGEEFMVLIKNGKKERQMVGKNSFPFNYGDFKELISGVTG
mgnify:CR=1 FL=1